MFVSLTITGGSLKKKPLLTSISSIESCISPSNETWNGFAVVTLGCFPDDKALALRRSFAGWADPTP